MYVKWMDVDGYTNCSCEAHCSFYFVLSKDFEIVFKVPPQSTPSFHVLVLSCSRNNNLVGKNGKYCHRCRNCITTEVVIERRLDIKSRYHGHKSMLNNHNAYTWLAGLSSECRSRGKKSSRSRTVETSDGENAPKYDNQLFKKHRKWHCRAAEHCAQQNIVHSRTLCTAEHCAQQNTVHRKTLSSGFTFLFEVNQRG